MDPSAAGTSVRLRNLFVASFPDYKVTPTPYQEESTLHPSLPSLNATSPLVHPPCLISTSPLYCSCPNNSLQFLLPRRTPSWLARRLPFVTSLSPKMTGMHLVSSTRTVIPLKTLANGTSAYGSIVSPNSLQHG